jgi:hypothetical protein
MLQSHYHSRRVLAIDQSDPSLSVIFENEDSKENIDKKKLTEDITKYKHFLAIEQE